MVSYLINSHSDKFKQIDQMYKCATSQQNIFAMNKRSEADTYRGRIILIFDAFSSFSLKKWERERERKYNSTYVANHGQSVRVCSDKSNCGSHSLTHTHAFFRQVSNLSMTKEHILWFRPNWMKEALAAGDH